MGTNQIKLEGSGVFLKLRTKSMASEWIQALSHGLIKALRSVWNVL